MANTIVWNKHDYAVSLRKRLKRPTVWKDILEVIYTDVRTFVRGAMTTEPSVQSHARGTAYSYQDMTLALDTGTIDQSRVLPIFIDWADMAQQSYVNKMNVAELQGEKMDEAIEALVYANHASWTDFGATDLADGADNDTTQIEISATNVDNLIRQIKRKIYENNGVDLAVKNGIFAVWTASEWAIIEEFAQANGYQIADLALKNGIAPERAFHYMGVDHFLTTQQTANHRFAGVKKLGALGILKSTYGLPFFNQDPAGSSNNALSGLGIVTRTDYGFEFCGSTSYYKELWIDINTTT